MQIIADPFFKFFITVRPQRRDVTTKSMRRKSQKTDDRMRFKSNLNPKKIKQHHTRKKNMSNQNQPTPKRPYPLPNPILMATSKSKHFNQNFFWSKSVRRQRFYAPLQKHFWDGKRKGNICRTRAAPPNKFNRGDKIKITSDNVTFALGQATQNQYQNEQKLQKK